MIRCLLVIAMVGIAYGQTPQQQAPPRGSISGRVTLEGSGLPLEFVSMRLTTPQAQNQAVSTDANGIYRIPNLPPGRYRMRALRQDSRGSIGDPLVAFVDVLANNESKLDFKMPPLAEVRGTVTDRNREPVANVRVSLIHTIYGDGDRSYVDTHLAASTNDLGEYVITGVPPDHRFLVYVEPSPVIVNAISPTPTDPALRKPVPAPTYYPSAPDFNAAQSVMLRSGETLTGINIQMLRTRAYCVGGTALPGPGYAPAFVSIYHDYPLSGRYSDSLHFRTPSRYRVDPSGSFRACGLNPGKYRLFVEPLFAQPQTGLSDFYGRAEFTVTDKDLPSIPIEEQGLVDVPVEVVWDADPLPQPVTQPVTLSFGPLSGASNQGRSVRPALPGTATLEKLRMDAYVFFTPLLPPGVYLKQATYGGVPVGQIFIPQMTKSGPAPVFRAVMAHDGGSVVARARDRNGPLPGQPVLLIPATAANASEVHANYMTCFVEGDGVCRTWARGGTSGNSTPTALVPPGKYYLLATTLPYDPTADDMDIVWRLLSKATQVIVAPNSAAEATVEPVALK